MNKPRRPPRRQVDGVLLLDKPSGISSNAALQKARWLFNAAKAGHTGTLDPMATGLLPLCFGEATKFAGELLDADKSYRATLKLGMTTDTADADGKVLETRPVSINEAQWRAATADFCGEIEQIPPMHSALKRDGKPLYEYARVGIELERQARRVTIYGIETISFAGDQAIIDVDCSKGTYIRTLAADIGERLGCGAHLTALRRIKVVELNISQSLTLDAIEAALPEARDHLLRPADALLARLPIAYLSEPERARLLKGQSIFRQGSPTTVYRLYSENEFLGLGQQTSDGYLQPRRLMRADTCK